MSSANKAIDAYRKNLWTSLMYKKNNKGPKMEPWGTPIVTLCCAKNRRYESSRVTSPLRFTRMIVVQYIFEWNELRSKDRFRISK